MPVLVRRGEGGGNETRFGGNEDLGLTNVDKDGNGVGVR